jgi:hypothetical protein
MWAWWPAASMALCWRSSYFTAEFPDFFAVCAGGFLALIAPVG